MSLQLAAQHLSNHGRGNDSTLVHMSPREVKSLNDLAMAHGGQLSINPQTGLPEAGFLSSILPMVAGFALGPAGMGLTAAQAGLAAGALGFAMTGSLEKGLMAGLGAYGGAGIGGSLTEVGMDAAVAKDAAVQAAQENAAKVTENFYNPTGGPVQPEYVKAAQQASMDASAAQTAARTGAQTAYDKLKFMEKMGQSFDTLKAPGGAGGLFDKISSSPMSLLKTVGSAAAPAIGEAAKPKTLEEEKVDKDMGPRYGFSPNPTGGQQVQPGQNPLATTQTPTTTPLPTSQFDSSEKRHFAPSYTQLTPEQAKKLYGFAEGGVTQPATEPFPIPRYTNEGKQPSGETAALQAFKQMQAQRVAQAQPAYTVGSTPATGGAPAANAPTPTTVEGLYRTYLDRTPEQQGLEHWNKHFGSSVDADEAALFRKSAAPELAANKRQAEQTGGSLAHEYGEYLRQTRGEPNQLKAPTTPPPTTTNLADSGFTFDPITQRYSEIKGTLPAEGDAAADAFNIDNRPVVGYTAKGEKIYGENKKGPYGTAHWTSGMGSFAASGGLMDSYASGGMSNLGDYSDGGRLLRGPGDGVSDSIPAVIGKRQPARLADGEFVVPARIVSELGNGSTEAGARKLYAMMDRIQKARGKTVGKGKVAKNSRSEKHLPA